MTCQVGSPRIRSARKTFVTLSLCHFLKIKSLIKLLPELTPDWTFHIKNVLQNYTYAYYTPSFSVCSNSESPMVVVEYASVHRTCHPNKKVTINQYIRRFWMNFFIIFVAKLYCKQVGENIYSHCMPKYRSKNTVICELFGGIFR